MNDRTAKLTDKETEALCRLWLDCRLSRADELLLMKALADSDASTPLAEDVRALMGLETIRPDRMAFTKRGRGFFRRRRTLAATVAAVLTALALTTAFLNFQKGDSSVKCVVYANGEKVEDASLSQQMAKADYLESMRFMKEMEEFKRAQLKEANLADDAF